MCLFGFIIHIATSCPRVGIHIWAGCRCANLYITTRFLPYFNASSVKESSYIIRIVGKLRLDFQLALTDPNLIAVRMHTMRRPFSYLIDFAFVRMYVVLAKVSMCMVSLCVQIRQDLHTAESSVAKRGWMCFSLSWLLLSVPIHEKGKRRTENKPSFP